MSKSSSSGTAIDRVVRAVVAPWFRQQGFRRKGRFFSRAWADVIHLASVQASQWNTPQSAEFYVNIDVEWSACHRLWTGSANSSNPAHAPCFLRSRLQTAGGDQSWNAFQDVEVLSGQLLHALDEYAETFWRSHSDLADVLRRIEAGERLTLGTPTWLVQAALLEHFDRRAEALATIDSAASRGRPIGFDYRRIRGRISGRA